MSTTENQGAPGDSSAAALQAEFALQGKRVLDASDALSNLHKQTVAEYEQSKKDDPNGSERLAVLEAALERFSVIIPTISASSAELGLSQPFAPGDQAERLPAVLRLEKDINSSLEYFQSLGLGDVEVTTGEVKPTLSPEAQRIAEGFKRLTQGDPSDPRIAVGKIPKIPHYPPAQTEEKKGEPKVEGETKKLSPEAQAISDGFARILGGAHDPRISYGRIPNRPPGT